MEFKEGDIVQYNGLNNTYYQVRVGVKQSSLSNHFSGTIIKSIGVKGMYVGFKSDTFDTRSFVLVEYDTDKEVEKIIRGLNKLMDRYSGQVNSQRHEKKRTKAGRKESS